MRMLWLQPGLRPLFPEARKLLPDAHGMVALGGDIEPDALIEAYGKGVFPWDGNFPHPWFSPHRRALLRPERFHSSRSLERLARSGRYRVERDVAFRDVMAECMQIPRPGQGGTWITPGMIASYGALFDAGLGFSVAVRDDAGRLVGGLYGVRLGWAFFGESMFSRERDVSKLALLALCQELAEEGIAWIDCQQDTAHLRSLGSEVVSRDVYLDLLEEALARLPDGLRPDVEKG